MGATYLSIRGQFYAHRTCLALRSLVTFILPFLFSIHSIAINQCRALFDGHRSSLREYSAEIANHMENIWKKDFFELKETDFLKKDQTQGKEKIATLRLLGFGVKNGELVPPSYDQFVTNYIQILKQANVPEDRRILPAVVFVRGTGPDRQYKLVTPGLDPWPSEPGFQVLKASEEFNLPANVVREAILRGRYPLMESPHDLFHFVSFAMNPRYMMALFEGHQRIAHLPLTPKLEARIFFVQEALTLGDPKKISEMKSVFAAARSGIHQSFDAYSEFFRKMSNADLVAHAYSLIGNYEKFLADYGGGVARSWEKYDSTHDFYWDKYGETFLTSTTLSAARGSFMFRNNAELLFGSVMKSFPFLLRSVLEIRNLSSDQILKIVERSTSLHDFLVDPRAERFALRPDYRDRLDQILADHIARMEYIALKTAEEFPIEVWIEQAFQYNPGPDVPLFRFVNEAYPIPGRGWNRMFQPETPK